MTISDAELSSESLCPIVQERYGLDGEIELRRIYEGRALNYHLSGDSGEWLLKIFQDDYQLQRVQLAADFCEHLARGNCAIQTFHRTNDGSAVSTVNGRPMILVRWITGRILPPNSLTSEIDLRYLGRLCGQLHRVAATFPQAEDLGEPNPSDKLSLDERCKNFDQKTHEASRTNTEIRDEIDIRRKILDQVGADLHNSESASDKQAIHGDFYCAHSVWQTGRPVGIIDAMGGFYFPGWEVMRCFVQSIPPIGNLRPDLLSKLWSRYVLGYNSEKPISQAEIEIAYDVYLLHLTLSAYGLRMPRSEPWHDAAVIANLREFGRWRTSTAHVLASQRASLRSMFASCVH